MQFISLGFRRRLGQMGNALRSYYQYLTLKGSDIISKDGGYVMENKGTGGEIVDAPILNTQIATFDGTASLQSDYDLDLWGITITAFTGTSTPTISGFNINFTAGTFEHMLLSNGDEYYVQEGVGIVLHSNGKPLNLFTRVDGNGTILPASGTYDDGDIVEIVAEPIDPLVTELSEIKVNGTQVATTSPYLLSMVDSAKVVAYFTSIYTTILDVFSQAPVDNEFVDLSGFGNNIAIINSPCAKLVSTNESGFNLPANTFDFNQDFDIEIGVRYETNPSNTQFIFSSRQNSGTGEFFSLSILTTGVAEFGIQNTQKITSQNAFTGGVNIFYAQQNNVVKVSRRENDFTMYINNITCGTFTRVTTLQSDVTFCLGYRDFLGYNPELYFDGEFHSFKFNSDIEIPNMAAPYDVTGNGNNFTIISDDLNELKSGKRDIYSYHLIKGFSFDGTDVIPALLDGTADAQGNPIQYPVGSGIIDGLPNEYTIPIDTELNTIIPSGNYTWGELDALVESSNLIKTKPNATTISRMVAKKKSTDSGLTNYTETTVYNESTSYI